MYILGLRCSWGTSRICPSWSSSDHLLAPTLSPFGGARVRSHAVRRRMFIVLMTSASFHLTSFPSKCSLATYSNYFIIIYDNSTHTHTYYASHSYVHLHLLFYTFYSHLCFFWSSWQAGCSRLLVSNTGILHCTAHLMVFNIFIYIMIDFNIFYWIVFFIQKWQICYMKKLLFCVTLLKNISSHIFCDGGYLAWAT